MPRIDYDEDDYDDDDVIALARLAPPAADLGWRHRAGLGFLAPYTLYLNHQVGQRFGQLQWQLPTRVFARPLQLSPGLAMDARTLKTELDAAAYRDDGAGVRPGTYVRDGGRWLIASRGFQDVGGKVGQARSRSRCRRARGQRQGHRAQNARSSRPRSTAARIATLYGQKQEERRLVQIEEVPELLVTGLQAVEDRDFARHHGIDLSGMLRAAWVNLRSGEKRQGASTLTQQLARSGLLGIGREQTFARKGKEILYAMLIEARYDKRTILEAYLNQVYLGQRGAQAIHGVAAASEFWFGRQLDDLSTEQIALMIGLVKGPSAYDPRRNPERALERRDFVLSQMLDTELINDSEFKRASKAPLASPAPGNVAATASRLCRPGAPATARDYPATRCRARA